MDWKEKWEHKKIIRKMAGRMLWADFRNMMLGWKALLLAACFFLFLLIPYVKTENYNSGAMYYFSVQLFMELNALAETSFNYLPLSSKDIVYYMKVRTNHQEVWLILLSVLCGIVLDVFGEEVFWERGLMLLLLMLCSLEWWFFMILYSYSKPEEAGFSSPGIPRSRKIKVAVFSCYSMAALLCCMLMGMFMEADEHAKTKLLVMTGVYLVMYIFRADAARWVRLEEFRKTPRRTMWSNTELLKQDA